MPWHPTACVHASLPPLSRQAACQNALCPIPLLLARSPCSPPVPLFRIAALLLLYLLVASTPNPRPSEFSPPPALAASCNWCIRCDALSTFCIIHRLVSESTSPPFLIDADGHILASPTQSNSGQCLIELVTGPAVGTLSAADHTSSRVQRAVVSYLPRSSLLPRAHKPHFRCQFHSSPSYRF